MLKKSFLILLVVFALSTVSYGGVMRCRSGVIVAAEITSANVAIANLSPHAFPQMPTSRCFAILSIKPDDMRVFSIFDYTLEVAGVQFPCVAIMRGGKFEYSTENISTGTNSRTIQQLLFVIDSKVVAGTGSIDVVLRSQLDDPTGKFDTIVPFKLIGNKAPTAAARIPAAGLLELPEE